MKNLLNKILNWLSYSVENIMSKYDQTNLAYLFLVAWLVAIPTSLIASIITFAVILFIMFIIDKINFGKNINSISKYNNNVKFALIGGIISVLIRLF